jgi:hypothetical protein
MAELNIVKKGGTWNLGSKVLEEKNFCSCSAIFTAINIGTAQLRGLQQQQLNWRTLLV